MANINFIKVDNFELVYSDLVYDCRDFYGKPNSPKVRREMTSRIQSIYGVDLEDITSESDVDEGIVSFKEV